MPIGKISKSGSQFSSAAEYDLAQGKYAKQEAEKKPEILDKNFLSVEHYIELGKEFRELANDNKNCKKPVLKFSVSFDPKEDLTDSQKIEFTKLVMKEMGIQEDNHQYLITRHSDKGHDHHHVLANRVGMNGKTLTDSYSKNRLETAIDKIEKMMGLSNNLAQTRRFVFDEKSEKGYKVQKENFSRNREKVSTKDTKKGVAEKKEYIKNQVEKALQESKLLSEFKAKLKENNVEAKLRLDKDNKLTGISFNYDNYSVKGLALGKEFKASGVVKILERNAKNENAKELTPYEKQQAYVAQEIEKKKTMSMEEKVQYMRKKKDRTFSKFSSEPAETIDNILEKDSSEITNLKLELRGNIVKVLDKLEPYRADKEMIWNTFSKMIVFLDSGRKFSEEDLKSMNKVAEQEIESINELEDRQEQERNRNRGFSR